MITFKQFRKASQSHGRGMDNTRTPAEHAVHKDGEHVATIRANSTRPYETPTYKIVHPTTGQEIKYLYKGGLKAAKDWALKNL
jgi:hypothetical protein